MSPFVIAQLLAVAGLVAFWALGRLHPSRATRYWLLAWACLVGSGLFMVAVPRLPLLEPGVVFLASIAPFMLLAGAIALAGRPVPVWLLAGAVGVGVVRAAALLLGQETLTYGLGLAISPPVFGATAVLLHRNLRDREASRAERALPWPIGAMGIVAAVWIGGRVFGAPWVPYVAPFLLVLGGVAVCLQMLMIVDRERRREEHLLNRNARLAGVVERSAQLIAWAQPDGRLRYVNPALRRAVGLDEDVDVGKLYLRDLFTPSEADRIEGECLSAVRLVGFWQGETAVRGPDGTRTPVGAVTVAEFGRSESVQAIYCIMTDLSERQRAAQALRRRYEFEHLIAGLSTYFVRLEPSQIDLGIEDALQQIGEFAGASRSFILLFREGGERMDYTHEWHAPRVPSKTDELQDLPMEQFRWSLGAVRRGAVLNVPSVADLPPEASAERDVWESLDIRSAMAVPLSLGTEWIGVLGLVSVGTEKAWSDDDLSLLKLAADLLANAIARKRGAQALAAREAELRQAHKMEAVGRLAGGVAHDFNNLLTVISGYARLLAQKLEADDERRAGVEEILRAAKRATTLTTQLLSFSHSQVLQARSFDLNACCRNLEEMLRPLIGEHVALETRLDPRLRPVHADPPQIEQVIVNLVVNARDAMPRGGVVTLETALVELPAEPSWRPATLEPGLWARLSVGDTGTGIDPEIRSQIFEPFFTTKAPGKGTGLGLSLVYGVVKRSGGAVQIESTPGEGTTVEVYLPLAEGAEEVRAGEPGETQRVSEGFARVRATVLLVEDDEMVRGIARRTLEASGHTVLEASDGKEALAVAESTGCEIDVLVSDIVIPYLSGPELADRLRRERAGLRVIFTSGYPRSIASGAAELPPNTLFLQKPFDADTLLSRVDELLESRPPSR